MSEKVADIVLEGGGVKGLGLVGAITGLEAAGYGFRRVAGTSAGAIVGSLLAAGLSAAEMKTMMGRLDYTKFRDPNLLDEFGPPGELLSLLVHKGVYQGRYLHRWLEQQLEALGVRTFADLKLHEDWARELPPRQRYKLVVIASDVSRGEMVRLPWDYARYGLDADKQLVADAVRASMSIPFFYVPARLRRSWLVDGGFLSNYPIDIFDRPGTQRWPTFGVKLSARPDVNTTINPVHSVFGLGKALLNTMVEAHDRMHLEDPAVIARTMFVDSGKVSGINFDISRREQTRLFNNGVAAAEKFLARWRAK